MTSADGTQDLSASLTSRALWIEGKGRCGVREGTLRSLAENEVLVRSLYSGISRGTESIIFDGAVPQSEFERMRGPHMSGEFPFPVKYGYSSVGLVEAGSAALIGEIVFCLHPHQDLFVTTKDMVFPLPRHLPPERAVLAANMETALNIVWDALIQPGDRVAVLGGGLVGTLAASLSSRIAGTETLLVDTNAARGGLAYAMQIPFVEAEKLEGEFDVLINASASDTALANAIDHAGMEARVVEASWYGDKTVSVPLGGAFHSKRLSLISSQVGSIPASRSRRWTFGRRLGKALELLKDDRLDHLITGETAFADLADDYPRILSSSNTLCHRIRY